MKNFYEKFKKQIITVLAILGIGGGAMLGFSPSSGYSETITATLDSTATTINVSSVTDDDGNTLALSSSNKGYFTIDPGQTDEERVVCSGVSGSTLTGCVRGLAASGQSESGNSSLASTHDVGSRIIMTNISQFYNNYLNIWDNQIVKGVKTFDEFPISTSSLPTLDYQFANKKYVDGVAVAGAPDATETVKGNVELATRAEMAAGTATGGTGANLCLWSDYAGDTSASTQMIAITESDGQFAEEFLPLDENLSVSGDWTFSGDNIFSNAITIPQTPTADTDAASKKYVDDNNIKYISASDNLKISADTERSDSDATYSKYKEVLIARGGTCRIKFDLKTSSAGNSAYGVIYINGSMAGAARSNDTETYQTFSEDFNVSTGDLLQLYLHGGSSYSAYGRNFRIYYDESTSSYVVNTD